MNRPKLPIIHERLDYDDRTLEKLYKDAKENLRICKEAFENRSFNYNENDYYPYLISKLSYDFAREEYNKLLFEMNKRGLDTEQMCVYC